MTTGTANPDASTSPRDRHRVNPQQSVRDLAAAGPASSSGSPLSSRAIDAFVLAKYRPVIINRTVQGVLLVLTAAGLLFLNSQFSIARVDAFNPWVYLVVAGEQLLLLAVLHLRPPADVQGLVLAGVVFNCAMVSWWSLAEGRPNEASILLVGYLMGCTAMVPWAPRYQVFAALAGIACVFVHTIWSAAGPDGVAGLSQMLMPMAVIAATIHPVVQMARDRRAGARDEIGRMEAEKALLTANSALESRVRERTSELEEVVAELRSFSYSISHDLRSPLRSINGFSQELEDEYGHVLGERGNAYLARVRSASVRMGKMIDALLGLARVSRTDLVFMDVDLSEIAREAAAELETLHPKRKVTWRIEGGLHVRGDAVSLRLVLQNLFSNSWKFTANTSSPAITFRRGTFADGAPCFVVEDNGVGFDPAHRSQLFQPFRRLHPDSDFEGYGVGLATVLRIVARHGGRVWADAMPGMGARFHFSVA